MICISIEILYHNKFAFMRLTNTNGAFLNGKQNKNHEKPRLIMIPHIQKFKIAIAETALDHIKYKQTKYFVINLLIQ